jgi:hypothetical protein
VRDAADQAIGPQGLSVCAYRQREACDSKFLHGTASAQTAGSKLLNSLGDSLSHEWCFCRQQQMCIAGLSQLSDHDTGRKQAGEIRGHTGGISGVLWNDRHF